MKVNNPVYPEIDTNELAKEATAAGAKTEATAVKSLIGATNNTGGSATAGTVFGKLNKLITDVTGFVGNWTAARAAKVDTIATDVNLIKGYTDTLESTLSTVNTNVSSIKTSVGSIEGAGWFNPIRVKETCFTLANTESATNKVVCNVIGKGKLISGAFVGTLGAKSANCQVTVTVDNNVILNVKKSGHTTSTSSTDFGIFKSYILNLGVTIAQNSNFEIIGVPQTYIAHDDYIYHNQIIANPSELYTIPSSYNQSSYPYGIAIPIGCYIPFSSSLKVTINSASTEVTGSIVYQLD